MMVVRSRACKRIAVVLPESTPAKHRRELGAFARYGIRRVEHELGERDSWIVSIAPSLGGYASHIAVRSHGQILQEQGNGQDGVLATWDAMCRVEQRLREHRRESAVRRG
jgi:hypothetical protein